MGGKPARKAVRNFAAQVVELAFVRDRIDRGFGDDRVYAMQNEEAYAVHAARAAAPALQGLHGYRRRSAPSTRVASRRPAGGAWTLAGGAGLSVLLIANRALSTGSARRSAR